MITRKSLINMITMWTNNNKNVNNKRTLFCSPCEDSYVWKAAQNIKTLEYEVQFLDLKLLWWRSDQSDIKVCGRVLCYRCAVKVKAGFHSIEMFLADLRSIFFFWRVACSMLRQRPHFSCATCGVLQWKVAASWEWTTTTLDGQTAWFAIDCWWRWVIFRFNIDLNRVSTVE